MKTLRRVAIALAAVTAVALATAGHAAPPPVQAFFAPSIIRGPDLDPTGRYVAYLHTQDGYELIVVWDLKTDERTPILNFPEPDAHLAWLEWANEDRIIFSVDVPLPWAVGVRARGRMLYGIDKDGENVRHLGKRWFGRGSGSLKGRKPGDELIEVKIQYEDHLLHMLPDDPEHVLLQIERPEKKTPGVYKVAVDSGRLKSVLSDDPKIFRWRADHDGVVRVGLGEDRIVARTNADDDFRPLDLGPAAKATVEFLGFTYDPKILLLTSTHGDGDRAAVYEYDIASQQWGKQVFAHPEVDVGTSLRVDRRRRVVTGLRYVHHGDSVYFMDEQAARKQAAIDRALPDRVNRIVSKNRNGTKSLLRSSSDTVPPTYYFFDRPNRHLQELYTEYPMLYGHDMASIRAVSYTARDGLAIPAYLTEPVGAAKPYPVIVMPHGGPHSRDIVRFDPEVQFFASRGYAVLQPNFRGSTGYGEAFEAKGFKQWGLAMQDDLTDGVKWLIAEGIADPTRIAIFGASYGGYAAMMGLAKTPTLYRCGASYGGVMDLLTMLSDDTWYEGGKDWWDASLGTSWGDRDRLKATSPVNLAEQITVPVFLAHGREDETVHVKHAEAMADTLEDADKAVELMIFDHEIHGYRNQETAVAFYTKLEAFLAKCLAPRATAADAAS